MKTTKIICHCDKCGKECTPVDAISALEFPGDGRDVGPCYVTMLIKNISFPYQSKWHDFCKECIKPYIQQWLNES